MCMHIAYLSSFSESGHGHFGNCVQHLFKVIYNSLVVMNKHGE